MARSRRPVRNPTEPRLRYVAQNYSPNIFRTVVIALFNAMGRDEAAREITNQWVMRVIRTSPSPPPGRRVEEHDYSHGDDFIEVMFSFLRAIQESGEPESTPYDKYLPWLAAQLSRMYKPTRKRFKKDPEWHLHEMDDAAQREDIERSNMLRELENRFGAIVRWADAEGVDINQYSAQEALDASHAWGLLQPKGDIVPGEIVYTFDDGWTFQELKTRKQLECEGRQDVLFHCVSGYKPRLIGKEYRIFSLRDPDGWPHATMEWRVEGEYVAQFKGYDNKVPERDEVERAVEFRRSYIDENLVSPENKLEQISPDSEAFPAYVDEFDGTLIGVYMPPGRFHRAFALYDGGGFRDPVVSVEAIPRFVQGMERMGQDVYGAENVERIKRFVRESVQGMRASKLPTPLARFYGLGPAVSWEIWKQTGLQHFDHDELVDQAYGYSLHGDDHRVNPRKRRKAKRKATKRKATKQQKRLHDDLLIERAHRLWETYDAKPLKKNLIAFGTHVERMKKSGSLEAKVEARRAARAFNAEFRARGWKKPVANPKKKAKKAVKRNPIHHSPRHEVEIQVLDDAGWHVILEPSSIEGPDESTINAVKLVDPDNEDYYALITRSARDPGQWQATRFDERGPAGHSTRDTLIEALNDTRKWYGLTVSEVVQKNPRKRRKRAKRNPAPTRKQLLTMGRGACPEGGSRGINCRLFAEMTYDVALGEGAGAEWRRWPVVPYASKRPGDLLVWSLPVHYAIYLGKDDVMEVEEYGADMRVHSLEAIIHEEIGGEPDEVRRPPWR